MKKKLVISQKQFKRLDEFVLQGEVDSAELANGEAINQLRNVNDPDAQVNISVKNNENNPNAVSVHSNGSEQIPSNTKDVTVSKQDITESITLTKNDIKLLGKLNENDSVYSKKSFKKILENEYTEFYERLNNKRNRK